jgi:hypothetical protein
MQDRAGTIVPIDERVAGRVTAVSEWDAAYVGFGPAPLRSLVLITPSRAAQTAPDRERTES